MLEFRHSWAWLLLHNNEWISIIRWSKHTGSWHLGTRPQGGGGSKRAMVKIMKDCISVTTTTNLKSQSHILEWERASRLLAVNVLTLCANVSQVNARCKNVASLSFIGCRLHLKHTPLSCSQLLHTPPRYQTVSFFVSLTCRQLRSRRLEFQPNACRVLQPFHSHPKVTHAMSNWHIHGFCLLHFHIDWLIDWVRLNVPPNTL